jgi:hypothetical protein
MSENQNEEVALDEATENQGNLTSADLLGLLSKPAEAEEDVTTEEEVEASETESVFSQSDDSQEEVEEVEESEEDDETDQETEEPKGVKKLVRQVGKLTARAKSAEEQVTALQAQVESLKVDSTTSENPTIDNIQTIEELEELRQQALSAKKWARQNEGEPYVTEGDKEYTSEEIKQIRDQAEDHLDEMIPDRLKFLQKKAGSEQQAVQDFDFINDTKSEEFKLLQTMMNDKSFAPLNNLPNGLYLRALMVEGHFSKLAKKSPKKSVRKIKPNPPMDTASDVSPPVRGAKKSDSEMRKKYLGDSNISSDQLTAFLTNS